MIVETGPLFPPPQEANGSFKLLAARTSSSRRRITAHTILLSCRCNLWFDAWVPLELLFERSSATKDLGRRESRFFSIYIWQNATCKRLSVSSGCRRSRVLSRQECYFHCTFHANTFIFKCIYKYILILFSWTSIPNCKKDLKNWCVHKYLAKTVFLH